MLALLYASWSGDLDRLWRLKDIAENGGQGERKHWSRESFEGWMDREEWGYFESQGEHDCRPLELKISPPCFRQIPSRTAVENSYKQYKPLEHILTQKSSAI